jgi:hypothetical protein
MKRAAWKERPGYFRATTGCRCPKAEDLAALNRRLLEACQQDEYRAIAGREQTIGTALLVERDHLLPLTEGFDLAQVSFPTVNGFGCVKVLTNAYSAPLSAGVQVQAKVYAATVELWHEGRCVARHERCYRRQQQILELEHYLDVLYRKPGAMAGSKPLEQRRQAGLWPPSFDRIWQALMERHGKQNGTRQMIELLKLAPKHGQTKLQRPSNRHYPASVMTPQRSGTCSISTSCGVRTAKRRMSAHWSATPGRFR